MPAMPTTAEITPERLHQFAPLADAVGLAPHLAREAERCEINTPLRVAHFLAQLHHESAGFTRTVESLSYSAERLVQVWPNRFPTVAAAQPYARNPAALAEKTYGGRMGNTHPGDGARFIGRGFVQITGRDNYAAASKWTGLDLIADPDLAAKPMNAAKIAADFWRVKGLNALADADNVAAITKSVNGGAHGLDERTRLKARAASIWRA